jgi:hypothetical protein
MDRGDGFVPFERVPPFYVGPISLGISPTKFETEVNVSSPT